MYAGRSRLGANGALCLGVILAATLSCRPAVTEGTLSGAVHLSGPVDGAVVTVFSLDQDGQPAERLGETITGSDGRFSLDTGTRTGPLLLIAVDGQTIDIATDQPLPLDIELRTVLVQYFPNYRSDVAITPLTTIATALAESRLDRGDREQTHAEAIVSGYTLLGDHFGGLDLAHTVPSAADEPTGPVSQDAVRHGLILAGLSSLASRIADRAGLSPWAFHTGLLTEALVADARGPQAVFDGMGPDGALRIGTCSDGCALGANTIRADLAIALGFEFVPSPQNGTGLGVEDVRLVMEALQSNREPELFGGAATETLDEDAPMLMVLPSPVRDELGDDITFDENAVPTHLSFGPERDLANPNRCPTVAKHVHRLRDPADNPLRWILAASDQGGGVAPDGVEYRVRLPSQNLLLTDWTAATEVISEGMQYEVVLLRDELPELATTADVFEVSFRATDRFGNVSPTTIRCWTHTPLEAPLWVSAGAVSVAPGSIDQLNLDPDSNLAAALNGNAEAEIMDFEVRNGTDEVVYVTLSYRPQNATYSKTWVRTNVELFTDESPDPNCPLDPLDPCHLMMPPEFAPDGDAVSVQPIPETAWAVRLWDITTGNPAEIDSCAECDPDEYRIEPRLAATRPRQYRIALVLSNSSVLAPAHPAEMEIFSDSVIDPIYHPGMIFTGAAYGTWSRCDDLDPASGDCGKAIRYRHIRALLGAEIRVPLVTVVGRVASTAQLVPRRPFSLRTFRDPVILPAPFQWSVLEAPLPPTFP